jgi:hypothetical protein
MHKKQREGKTASWWAVPNRIKAIVAGANNHGEGRYAGYVMDPSRAIAIYPVARDYPVVKVTGLG